LSCSIAMSLKALANQRIWSVKFTRDSTEAHNRYITGLKRSSRIGNSDSLERPHFSHRPSYLTPSRQRRMHGPAHHSFFRPPLPSRLRLHLESKIRRMQGLGMRAQTQLTSPPLPLPLGCAAPTPPSESEGQTSRPRPKSRCRFRKREHPNHKAEPPVLRSGGPRAYPSSPRKQQEPCNLTHRSRIPAQPFPSTGTIRPSLHRTLLSIQSWQAVLAFLRNTTPPRHNIQLACLSLRFYPLSLPPQQITHSISSNNNSSSNRILMDFNTTPLSPIRTTLPRFVLRASWAPRQGPRLRQSGYAIATPTATQPKLSSKHTRQGHAKIFTARAAAKLSQTASRIRAWHIPEEAYIMTRAREVCTMGMA